MCLRALVIDSVPVFRDALASLLREAGFDSTAANLGDPGAIDRFHLVIMRLVSQSAWGVLSDIRLRVPALPIVAVVTEDSPALHLLARGAGATSVLPQHAPENEIVLAAHMAIAGRAVVPYSAIKIDSGLSPARTNQSVSQDEVQWLRAIALGQTIRGLADTYGFSERAMHRRLAELYPKLGAQGLLQAVICMERWGLLEEHRS